MKCHYQDCEVEANPNNCVAVDEVYWSDDYIPGENYYYCDEHWKVVEHDEER